MPGEAWVGLNDINNENQFVWTDGTAAVSDGARNILCDKYNCKHVDTKYFNLVLRLHRAGYNYQLTMQYTVLSLFRN